MKQRLAYAGMGQRPMFAGGGGIPAEDIGKVKVSVEDSVEQFLNDKIIVEENIFKEVVVEQVGGCPIGKTYLYKGATDSFNQREAFINADISTDGGTFTLETNGSVTLNSGWYGSIIAPNELNLQTSEYDVMYKSSATFGSLPGGVGSNPFMHFIGSTFRIQVKANTYEAELYSVQFGAVEFDNIVFNLTDVFTFEVSIKKVGINSTCSVTILHNGITETKTITSNNYDFTPGLDSLYYAPGNIQSVQNVSIIDYVGDGLPNECTGEIFEEKLKLSSPISDFTTSFEFSNANQITVNTIIQCPSGEGNFGGANPNGTRSYFPGSSITGVKVDIRKYVTNGAGSITIQIRSRLADGNNTTDVSPTAGTLRYETTIPLQDTLGAERFGLSVTDEFRENPIVFTESEEVFVVVSGLTAQEVRGLLVDTALRASV